MDKEPSTSLPRGFEMTAKLHRLILPYLKCLNQECSMFQTVEYLHTPLYYKKFMINWN